MSKYLPLKVDPIKFADNSTSLQGILLIKNMERLIPSLLSDEGEVNTTIDFDKDSQGIRFLRCHLETNLRLQCQRCMEPFNYEIIDDFLLGLVQTEEEAKDLPVNFDPLVIKGIDISIQDVIEDELIISLPIVPMHKSSDCKETLPLEAEPLGQAKAEKDNPFKVVELLRQKRNKE